MALTLQITNVGRAALVNAANTGTLPVTIHEVGVSGTHAAVTGATTALAGEIKRLATFGGEVVANDTIHISIRDESTDVYSLKAFGLYLSDGTLFAVYSQAATILEKSAAALLLLAVDARFVDIAATSLSFGSTEFLNPQATEAVKGVVHIATDAEAAAHTNDRKAVVPKSLWFAFNAWFTALTGDIWRASNDGSGSGLDADLLDGKQGTDYLLNDGNLNTPRSGGVNVAGSIATHDWSGSPIYIREAGTVGASQSDASYAPSLAFVWNGVVGSALKMTADGAFRFRAEGTNPNVYRPIYAQNFYANGQLVWHVGNDGAGSGLDADLLDGQDSTYFTNISARLGYTPLNKAGDIMTGSLTVPAVFLGGALGPFLYSDGTYSLNARYGAAGDYKYMSLNGTTGDLLLGASKVWHVGNDGAGSGLDADLLDGMQASQFVRADGVPTAQLDQALIIASKFATENTGSGPIQIREVDYVGALTTATSYAPTLSFFWNAVASSAIKMTADGAFRFRASGTDPSAYRPIYAQNFYANGQLVWHVGNDGAGSGLDADLLDGQDSTYFTNISARLGYTPVNKAGDTMTGSLILPSIFFGSASGPFIYTDVSYNLNMRYGLAGSYKYLTFDGATGDLNLGAGKVWNAGNDGAGSGLDADLLDGQDSSYYTNIPARLGYTPVNPSSLSDVWRSTNDGSGSGLDADLLDGKHASDFVLANLFTDHNLAAQGHYLFPGGLLVNWFTTAALANDGQTTNGLSKPFTVLLGAVATAHMNNPVNDNWANLVNPPIGGICGSLTVSRGFPGGPGESGPITCIAWGIA